MENIGTIFPKVVIPEHTDLSILIQVAVFVIIIGLIIYVLRLYFKNMELKNNPEKNQTEIEENINRIEKIKKAFLKYGGIIFAIVIMATIILSNFY